MSDKLPYRKAPCKNCPFRKDCMKGWLGKERMTQIVGDDSFVCHKTTNTGNDLDKLQCAGHMILLKENNVFVRTASMMNIDLTLKNKHLIFDSVKEAIQHHKNR